ncbi:MAG: tetratricopeptide repeat protein [Spirochaetes bacterium]|jgi:tetratricopeptide (TPR) repeat protein|nr:tetratricopeptide repeat protein [Spirochaetota bacterium]
MFQKSIINCALAVIISLSAVSFVDGAGWEYYYRRGTIQFESEMYPAAMENLERALELNPSLYDAANKMARILIVLNKKRQALDYLDRSLAVKTDQADVQLIAGEIRDFFGYRQAAFAHYTSAVSIDPSYVRAHLGLVRWYIERKDTASADRHFAAAYAVGREAGERILARALEDEQKGDNARATAMYKEAIEKNPAYIEAYFGLAELYRRAARPDDAIATLEEIKKIRPDNEKAHVYLGHLYFVKRYARNRKHILKQAIRNFERAREINPANPETLYGLSEVYLHMGDRDRADEMREAAIALEKKRDSGR